MTKKSLGALFIKAYTSANYNGSPAGFGTEKALINVFQASSIKPVTVGKGENAEQMCQIDGQFVRYSFEKLRNELEARGVILPEPEV